MNSKSIKIKFKPLVTWICVGNKNGYVMRLLECNVTAVSGSKKNKGKLIDVLKGT